MIINLDVWFFSFFACNVLMALQWCDGLGGGFFAPSCPVYGEVKATTLERSSEC